MNAFLLVVAICTSSVHSQIKVPCYGEGCGNVAVYLGPRWGSRVVIMPRDNVEGDRTEATLEGSGDDEVQYRLPQHRPVPTGDVFRVDLLDDGPIGDLTTTTTNPPGTTYRSNYWRTWPRSTRPPWNTTTTRPWYRRPWENTTGRPWYNRPWENTTGRPWYSRPWENTTGRPWYNRPWENTTGRPWNRRLWKTTTGRPWANRTPNYNNNRSTYETQIEVDYRGTLDLSWRGYTGHDVKWFLQSLSEHDKSRVIRLLLDGNLISYLPAMTFPMEFEYNLRELSLNHNPISPPYMGMESITRFEISRMAHLKTLNMTHCGLTFLAMPHLPLLETLDLSYNSLTDLPFNIDRQTNLYFLYLRGNRITNIDDSLASLSNLYVLDLGSNGVKYIWGEPLEKLFSLDTLKLDNNFLTTLPHLYPSRDKTVTLVNNTLLCSCYLKDWVDMKYGEMRYDNLARCNDGPRSVFLDELRMFPEEYQHLCDVDPWWSRGRAAVTTWYRQNPDIMAIVYKIIGISILLAVILFLLRKRKNIDMRKTKDFPYNILDDQRVSTVSGPYAHV